MKKTLYTHQKGATLVIVMIMMLLISLIATLAFRKSSSDLKIATSAQVGKLLFQNTDLSLAKVEQASRSGNIEKSDNIVGFLRLFPDDEIVFCVRPTTNKLLDPSKMTHRVKGNESGYINGMDKGFCNPGTAGDYIGKRRAGMNQVTARRLEIGKKIPEAFGNEYVNSEIEARKIDGKDVGDKSEYYEIVTTSILPVYSEAKSNKVVECMQKGTERTEIDKCLEGLNVPYNTQIQNYQWTASGLQTIN